MTERTLPPTLTRRSEMAPTRKSSDPQTALDSDVTRPSVTQPGDGPADTTNPDERATSVPFSPGPQSLVAGTVNTVQPLPTPPAEPEAEHRTETYEALKPTGEPVTVVRNIETGETTTK